MDNKNNNAVSKFEPYFEINETPFVIKIGKTTYEVSTHFSIKGKETVLGQFKELLTELNIDFTFKTIHPRNENRPLIDANIELILRVA